MPSGDTSGERTLQRLGDRAPERNVFTLEMGPDGVRLRLDGAVLDGFLAIGNLVLSVPHARRSFDYTAGPRSLQSALTRLEQVDVELDLEAAVSRLGSVPGIRVAGFRARDGKVSVSGEVDGTPFTLRLAPGPGAGGAAGDLVLRFDEPRVYGWIGRAWDRLGIALAGTVPPPLGVRVDRHSASLDVLRPLLTPLLAGMGWKVPLLDGVALASVRVLDGKVRLRFQATPGATVATVPAPGGEEDTAVAEDPEAVVRAALVDRAPPEAGIPGTRLMLNGVVATRLWPEVLVAARALGEERPEWVLPHLVGVLLAARMPELVSAADVVLLARRLMAAVEASGDPADLSLAGRLVATIAFDLPPNDALSLTEALRTRGVADPVVLESAAMALDRLGRGAEARVVRARLMALAPAGRTGEVLRAAVDRLDRAGLSEVASGWLDETIDRCGEGRFGSEGESIRRQAQLLGAARESLAGNPAGRARLLDLLRRNPADPEALDLLLATAGSDREAAEAVLRMQEAAASVPPPGKARWLKDAALATLDRLGLRRQAADLLEEALAADPRDPEVSDLLDRVCADLGRDERRLSLARARLSFVSDPDARTEALLRVARLSESAGDFAESARCVAEVLRRDPTNREALEAGVRVFAAAGDEPAMVRAWETLLDLEARTT